jgi:hypothetical protein
LHGVASSWEQRVASVAILIEAFQSTSHLRAQCDSVHVFILLLRH